MAKHPIIFLFTLILMIVLAFVPLWVSTNSNKFKKIIKIIAIFNAIALIPTLYTDSNIFGYIIIIGWVLSILLAMIGNLIPSKKTVSSDMSLHNSNFNEQSEKKCPMCAEMVKSEALICRFCRHEF